jgi:eukaryotic-like serine/threonine-protein kinase
MAEAPFLKSGSSLGPYLVGERIGAGGMGEVYQARDTRLGRDVAIKVLPEAFAFDGERRRRLEREARLLASLNHPHIAAIHGIEETSGHLALVLELVEGPTLAEQLSRGPLAPPETVRIASQIAAALDDAHQKGIVHRDLKPANVKLAPGRGVKVLDFGLAKALGEYDSSDPAQAATITSDGTRAGVVLGTAAYMSPEQTRGLPVDKRTDIWAFGCVLYEMVSGRRAFPGATLSDTIAAILEREPDWQAIPPGTPAPLRQLLRRCLEKDPQRRLRDIGDAVLELTTPAVELDRRPAVAPVRRLPQRWVLATAALGLVALTAGATWLALGRREGAAPPPAGAVRFSIPPPPGNWFGGSLPDVETTYLALSPDGSQLAFVATDQKSTSRVWLRQMASLDARPLAGTEGTESVFWSPDGRSIGFFTFDQLKRLDLPDGKPVFLTKIPAGMGHAGTWTTDGRILFANIQAKEIAQISTAGGTSTTAVAADPGRDLRSYWPSTGTGGRLIYLAILKDGSGELKLTEPGGSPRTLTAVTSNAAWVDPGYVVFAREGTLLAQQVDPAQGRLVGDPHAIADAVQYSYLPARAMFTASRTGTVVYQSHRNRTRLVRIDRTGRELGTLGKQPWYWSLRASRDGRQIMTAAPDSRLGTNQLWLLDVSRGSETRFYSDPRPSLAGAWAPGDRTVVFSASRGGPPQLIQRDLVTGADRELLPRSGFVVAGDFTPDGKQLVGMHRPEGSPWQIVTVTLAPPAIRPLLPSSFPQFDPRLSRDGRAISFVSNESGLFEVYVSAFPITGSRIPVSSGGAGSARWSPDGQELFYLAQDGKIMVVPIRTTPSLHVGTPRALFSATRPWNDFVVSADGQTFIAIVPDVMAREQPLTAVLNWQSEIRR